MASLLKELTSTSTTKPAAKSQDERNREIALHHANIIQSQKDAETAITTAIETLIDFPSIPTSTSAAPDAWDIEQFRNLIYPFTPSDYDELIEERRIDKRCGYVFCRNPPKTTAGGKLKVVQMNGGRDAKIMSRGKAESWCSKECAKRGMFIKVQLMDEPVWERRASSEFELEILTLESEEQFAALKRRSKEREDRKGVEEMEGKMRELEVERGDEKKPARATGMIAETIVEKDAVEAPRALEMEDGHVQSIEGHMPGKKIEKGKGVGLGDRELDI